MPALWRMLSLHAQQGCGCGLWGSGCGGLAGVSGWDLKTDHWFYGLFQSAPDLIALLLPHGAAEAPSLGPVAAGFSRSGLLLGMLSLPNGRGCCLGCRCTASLASIHYKSSGTLLMAGLP